VSVVVLLAYVIASPALANDAHDSSVELGAGGIVLTKATSVSVDSEDIWISRTRVRVSYVFTNVGSKDVTAELAFPVPRLPICTEASASACNERLRIDEGDNPMHFNLTVDGKPKAFETTKQTQMYEWGVGSVSLVYHWEQLFPKGRSVRVQHEYIPAAGRGYTDADGHTKGKFEHEMSTTYCVGPKLLRELTSDELRYSTVKYILLTGVNWMFPVKTFKVTIAKQDPADKVSFCIPDARKVSPTTFEVVRHDFTPTASLNILFIPATNE
jgi:hypothetical protein